jgi:hypothetical protein
MGHGRGRVLDFEYGLRGFPFRTRWKEESEGFVVLRDGERGAGGEEDGRKVHY